MAGKQTRGVAEADADLFRGRPYVLTSREREYSNAGSTKSGPAS